MKKLILPFMVLALLVALPTYATDWYVDADNGENSSSCNTEDSPCLDANYVFSLIQGGDSVYITGTYAGNDARISMSASMSGTADGYTTIAAWPGRSRPVFSLEGEGAAFAINNIDYLQLEDLDINGSSQMGVAVIDSSAVILKGLNIYNNAEGGISVNTSSDVQVINNMIYSNASSEGSGVQTVDSSSVSILNNAIYNNKREAGGAPGFGAGIDLFNTTLAVVINNIISTNDVGLQVNSGSLVNMQLDYNNYYNNESADVSDANGLQALAEWQANTEFDTSSISLDPLFVSTTSGTEDLHIQSGSPCIDTGTTIANLDSDYDGEARPYGVAFDIGADERPVPPVPSDLGFDATKNSLTLSWLATDGYEVSSYTVKFGTESDLSDGIESNYDEAVATELNLTQAKTYYYQIKSVFTDGVTGAEYVSDYSVIGSATTLPKKVTNFKAKKKNKFKKAKKIKVSWKKQARTSFIIKVMNKKKKKIKNVTVKKGKTSTWITGLKPGKKYKLKMKARKKLDGIYYKSPKWSNIVSVRTAVK